MWDGTDQLEQDSFGNVRKQSEKKKKKRTNEGRKSGPPGWKFKQIN